MPFEETHVVDERTRFIEDVHRSLKSFTAICERYGISRTKATSGWRAGRLTGRLGWRIGPAVPSTAPGPPRPRLSRRSSICDGPTTTTGPRRSAGFCRGIAPSSTCPLGPPSITSCAGTISSPSAAGVSDAGTPVGPTPLPIRPTRAGARTSRASSRPAMVTSATRSPSRTCTRASCSPATAALMSPSMA